MSTSDPINAIITTLTDIIGELQQYRYDTTAAMTRLQNENTALKTENDALRNPPVKDKTPVLTKDTLHNVWQLTITLDAAPGASKDAIGLTLIKLAKRIGFNAVRYMRNEGEIANDVKLDALNPRNLPAQTKAQGLLWIADSLDAVVPKLNASALQVYCDNLKKAGAIALYLNDFDRAALAGQQTDIVNRIRAVNDLPLIASVSASADIVAMKKLVDYVECQAFGNASEFTTFLKLPCDILCLDGQKSASQAYLANILDQFLKSGKSNLAVYTAYDTGGTDWRTMALTVLAYLDFLARLKAA